MLLIAEVAFLLAAVLATPVLPLVTYGLKQAGLSWIGAIAAAIVTYGILLLLISDL